MRPRLPLCLLPFVGMAFFAMTTNSSEAITIQAKSSKYEYLSWLAPFEFNGWDWDRSSNVITSKNLLLSDTTISFRTQTLNGINISHPGAGTDWHYRAPVILRTYDLLRPDYPSQSPSIGIARHKTLTFSSSYVGTAPIETAYLHSVSFFRVGNKIEVGHRLEVPDEAFVREATAYFFDVNNPINVITSQLGGTFQGAKLGEGNIEIKLRDTNELLIINSTGYQNVTLYNARSTAYAWENRVEEINIKPPGNEDMNTYLSRIPYSIFDGLEINKPNTDGYVFTSNPPANVEIQGNFTVNKGTLLFADSQAVFKVGYDGEVDLKNQSSFIVNKDGKMIFSAGVKADFYSKVVVDGGYMVLDNNLDPNYGASSNKMSATFYSGITSQNIGRMEIYTNNTVVKNGLKAIDGGRIIIGGNSFTIDGAVTVDGFLKTSGSIDALGSRLIINPTSTGGIFYDNVSVTNFGSLWVDSANTIFMKDLNITQNGILRLGSDNVAHTEIKGNFNVGNNARIEINTKNTVSIGGSNSIDYKENGYLAFLGDPAITYMGNTSVTKNNAITITVPYTDSKGQYWESVSYGGQVRGEGALIIDMLSSSRRVILSGDNLHTGGTMITDAFLEITKQATLGAPGSVLKFNRSEHTSGASFGLSSDYDGTDRTEKKYLSTDIIVGNGRESTNAFFVTGDYNKRNPAGEIHQIQLAETVEYSGKISTFKDLAKSNFIKEGNGELILTGLGKDGSGVSLGYQVELGYTGTVIVQDGTLSLMSKQGISVINPEVQVYLYNDRDTTKNPTLKLGEETTEFKNNVIVYENGTINAASWQSAVLGGNIYSSPDNVYNRTLTIVGNPSGLTLAGDVVFNGNMNIVGATELIVQGNFAYGENMMTTLNLSNGSNKASLIFDLNNVDSYFGSIVEGGNEFIKRGSKTLYIASNLNGSYEGNTIIESGDVVMNGGFINSQTSLDLNGGALKINGSKQAVQTMSGGGHLDNTGELSILGGHDTSTSASFSGSMSGGGLLTINTTNGTFVINRTAPWNNDAQRDAFTGFYNVQNGTMKISSHDYLSHNAGITMGTNGKLNLIADINLIPDGPDPIFTNQSISTLYSGEWNGNSLVLNDNSKAQIDIASYVELTIGNTGGADSFYSGGISGEDARLIKVGQSTLTLKTGSEATGPNFTYTGDTLVKGGTLVLDAVDLSSSAFVKVEGENKTDKKTTLIANLTNGNVTIKELEINNAFLSTQGHGTDYRLSIKDALTLKNSTIDISAHINNAGLAEVNNIIVDGDVFVKMEESNIINMILAPGNWNNQRLLVFQANPVSDLSGITVIDHSYLLNFVRDTDETSKVIIDVVKSGNKFVTLATNNAMKGAGAALDMIDKAYETASSVPGYKSEALIGMDHFYILDEAGVRAGLATVAGSSTYALPTARLLDVRQQINRIRDRAATLGTMPNTHIEAGQYRIWGGGVFSQNTIDSADGIPGFDKDTWGGFLGFDTDLNDNISWGVSFTYTDSDIKIKNGDDSNSQTYYIDLFGRYQKNNWNVIGILNTGISSGEANRTVAIGEYVRKVTGDPAGVSVSGFGEVAYDFHLNEEWVVSPLANMTLGYMMSDGYTEAGAGDLGLDVSEYNELMARIGIGARARYNLPQDRWEQPGRVEVRAIVVQDLTDASADVTQRIIGGGNSYTAGGANIGKTAFQVGAGAVVPVAYNWAVFADVNTEFRTGETNYGVSAGARYSF